MSSVKEIDIINRTHYFMNDMINIKNLNAKKIKIDEKTYKNYVIYHIGCVTFKDFSYITINSVNPLYLIINKINGYIDESS